MSVSRSYDEQWVSRHCALRMSHRGIRHDEVTLALDYGEERYIRGAVVYFIGRRSIEAAKRVGVDLQHLHGLHVVAPSSGGKVITTYTNKSPSRRESPYNRRRRRD